MLFEVSDAVSFDRAHLDDAALPDIEEIGENYQLQGQPLLRNLFGAANANSEIRVSGDDLHFEAPPTIQQRQYFVFQLLAGGKTGSFM